MESCGGVQTQQDSRRDQHTDRPERGTDGGCGEGRQEQRDGRDAEHRDHDVAKGERRTPAQLILIEC